MLDGACWIHPHCVFAGLQQPSQSSARSAEQHSPMQEDAIDSLSFQSSLLASLCSATEVESLILFPSYFLPALTKPLSAGKLKERSTPPSFPSPAPP